jgi:hypothetical protein
LFPGIPVRVDDGDSKQKQEAAKETKEATGANDLEERDFNKRVGKWDEDAGTAFTEGASFAPIPESAAGFG